MSKYLTAAQRAERDHERNVKRIMRDLIAAYPDRYRDCGEWQLTALAEETAIELDVALEPEDVIFDYAVEVTDSLDAQEGW